jgi:hypothetical protein
MIGIIFSLGGDVMEIRIDGNEIYFRSNQSPQFATLEGLQLNKEGVIKEFPDLKDDEEWRTKAIARFKKHFRERESEREKVIYVIQDLIKFGWIPIAGQRKGFRVEKVKAKVEGDPIQIFIERLYPNNIKEECK